jgi:hypothetical protein
VPICIAGMPFSGISLVARILADLGLDLGPERSLDKGKADDSSGNRRFVRLNDEILDTLDAAWDNPPDDGGRWPQRPQLEPLRQRAAVVSNGLGLAEPWGWADPRNSLTLPFWRELFPDLRVVVCVRHPHEVATSLEARGSASCSEGLTLWRSYYGALADLGDDERIVTDYARCYEDPRAEVERLAEAVALRPSRAQIRRAAATLVTRNGGDIRSDDTELPSDVRDLYQTLLEAASAPARGQAKPSAGTPVSAEREAPGDLRDAIAAQRLELEHLRLELARRRGYSEALQAQLDVRAASEVELREVTHGFEGQLLERDEEIAALRREIEWRIETEDSLRRAVTTLEERVAAVASVEQTRLWRLGQHYWSLKQSIRRTLERGRS